MGNMFGPLPTGGTVMTVFAQAAELGVDAVHGSGGRLCKSLAGLVDAHRRMAVARPDWDDDDVKLSWASGQAVPVLAVAGGGVDEFVGAWEDAQRHMLDIDQEAYEVLAEVSAEGVEHHEGLGAVFGRMAHLYTISFKRVVLDGPEGRNRQQLGRSLVAYESLARNLACGRVYLPSPLMRPDS